MAGVNGVDYRYNYDNVKNTKSRGSEKADDSKAAEAKAAEETKDSEKKESAASTQKQQSETYKPDMEKIRQMKADLRGNLGAFKQMVYSQIKDQGNHADYASSANDALKDILKGIQGMSQEEAAAAVADDGEWGVDATANRILDFAKAISGGDPSKIGTLRDAVEKGYAAAGKIWGGDLPEISQKTLQKVMEGFDEWEKSGSADKIGTQPKE